MNSLKDYAEYLANLANLDITNGQLFAKVLTPNDDSGRHGVLVPTDVYSFFPHLPIADPTQNATATFSSFDAISRKTEALAFKYYQRYPERRITCVNGLINARALGPRLQVFLRGELANGEIVYVHDAANTHGDGRFAPLWQLIAGTAVEPAPGAYVVVPIEFKGIRLDDPLEELLGKFDAVRGRWIESLRAGDTGIGYTFESLLGIRENNDQTADFRGIELKCKQRKHAGGLATGKLNLFQLAPTWLTKEKTIDRLKTIGNRGSDGRYSCYSQVTTTPNNLLLHLIANSNAQKIELQKGDAPIAHWLHRALEKRLLEKHSRAAFIIADVRKTKAGTKFLYDELIYCEQPAIDRFLDLVTRNQLVFEFTMSEKQAGKVRNHGYPWRLNREDLLDQRGCLNFCVRGAERLVHGGGRRLRRTDRRGGQVGATS